MRTESAAPTTPTDARHRATVLGIHAAVAARTGAQLPVRLWDGTELGPADASFRIVLTAPWSLRALLLPPTDLAAGEAYVFGDVELEGDIVAAMAAGERIAEAPWAPRDRLWLLGELLRLPRPPRRSRPGRAALRGRRHSQRRDQAAIAFHYDLPDAFYQCFLDAEQVYSCGYFLDPDESVDVAQRRKLDLVCRKLRLSPGKRLLDIGCGWGTLLIHAAREYGAQGVGVTLSRTQVEAGNARIAAEGLAEQVEIRLADYRDLSGSFDAIASVGMFEHVGVAALPTYFATAWRLLAPGGLFLNHGIVTGDAERIHRAGRRTFVATYVFPDGELVPAWRAVRELQRPGFELVDVEQLRASYALTLREWIARLEAKREAAVAAAGEHAYRTWRAYMAGSAHSFERRSLGVLQILGAKPSAAARDLPLGRAWMLADDDAPT